MGELVLDQVDETSFLRQRVQIQGEILNHLPDGVLVVDGTGKILLVNRALCLFTQYEERELRFKNLSMLVPERYRLRHADLVQRFSASNAMLARYMGESAKLFPLLLKDGCTAPVDIAISRLATQMGTLCIAVIRWELPR